MRVENNNIIAQQENKGLGAELSAHCEAEADNPRKILLSAWQELIAGSADWMFMITLTVSNEHLCGVDAILRRFSTLIQILNRDLLGKHYIKKVGHCYFSYVVGVEYTKNGVVHLHLLVDMPLNFELVHRIWNFVSGFAYIKPVTDKKGVSNYMCKYVAKEQDLIIRIRHEDLPRPKFLPFWYIDNLSDGHPHKDILLSQV